MDWDLYTVFSLISGLCLVGLAVAPGLTARDRFVCLAAGVGIGGYGLYVAAQTSGTYGFPVQIFIVPPLLAVYAIAKIVEPRRTASRRA